MRRTVVLMALAAVASAVSLIAAGPLTVDAKVCTSVKDRAPAGVSESFPAAVGELYCFTEVTGGPGAVSHVWIHGDKELTKIELPVKAGRWRTWSAKRITPAMAGDWRVEVRDPAGAVLATVKFAVK